jgi:D-xylose transport system substrate-binding protein
MVRGDGGQRSETVRRGNLSALVRVLHGEGPRSRSELGRSTGLTRSGIRRLVGDLASAGLVTEARGQPSGVPGRPSPLVSFQTDRAVVLALEIAVDSLAMAVVGLGGQVMDLVRVERTRRRFGVEETTADLVALADGAAVKWRTNALVGIGVAVVGVVRRHDGFVSMAPNLGWREVPLGAELRRALRPRAPLVIANEADLGALAEHRRGAAAGADDLIFLSGEVGLGGGLIVGGRPLTGVAGFAGEVGHLPVNPLAGASCRCGAVGCWETEVGEEALLVRAGQAAGGGRAAVEAVVAAAESGDARALAALAEVGRWLGIGLAGLVNTLSPARVVLGGRLALLHPFVLATLQDELDRRALVASRAHLEIVPATLGVDAPLLGAAELAFEPFLNDPDTWVRSRRPARAGSAHPPTIRGTTTMHSSSRAHRGTPRSHGGNRGMHVRRSAALVMSAALVLAACGGDDDDDDAGGGTAATSAGATDAGGAPTTEAGGGATTEAGGSTGVTGGGGNCVVGVSWNNYQEERWAKWDEPALKEAIEAGGGSYISNDAKSSAETQATNVENLISQGANVLVVLAQDGTAILPSVSTAVDQGIPVIAYDRLIDDPTVLYLSFDNVKVGELEAQAVLDQVDSGNFIIIKGNSADANADFLRQGYVNAGIPAEGESSEAITIVGESYTDNWDASIAQTQTEQFLTAADNDVQAVLSENDGMAGGVVAALEAQGLAGKVPVSGQDGDQAALNRIALGTQTVSVWKDARLLGEAAGKAALELCESPDIADVSGTASFASPGGNDLTSILLTPQAITKDNLDVVVDAGWIDEQTLCEGVEAGSVAACG